MITFASCTLELPVKFLDTFDKIRRRCLWEKKSEHGQSCNSLVAWKRVCCPKDKGGLRVINTKVHNQAHLLKFLDKFYNQADLQWVKLLWESYYTGTVPHAVPKCGSFWWRSMVKLIPIYRGFTKCEVRNGLNVSMWHDNWNGLVLSENYACLYSYSKVEDISVHTYYETNDLNMIFHLPLSPEALNELHSIDSLKPPQILETESTDQWSYPWGPVYSAKKSTLTVIDKSPVRSL